MEGLIKGGGTINSRVQHVGRPTSTLRPRLRVRAVALAQRRFLHTIDSGDGQYVHLAGSSWS